MEVDEFAEVPNKREGLRFLSQCSDMNGDHWSFGLKYTAGDCPRCEGSDVAVSHVPCSRYGDDTRECALVAWRHAYLIARDSGEPMTYSALDHSMSLVVNNRDDVFETIRDRGYRHYR